ncbi:MAG: transposase [Clostridiales bacterium]|nr:transposase [Clostridiales bacterium]
MNKSFKYRIYPNNEQVKLIEKTFGCTRFVFNHILSLRKKVYEEHIANPFINKIKKYPKLSCLKEEFEWLREVDSLALCHSVIALKRAYTNFFSNRTSFPKFKSKHFSKKSYTTNNQKGSIRIINKNTIRIPKLKNMKIKLHRDIPEHATIKSATISKTSTGKYFILILVFYIKSKSNKLITHSRDSVIGLDYSSSSLIVDSLGNQCDYPKYYRQSEDKLNKEQRKLSNRKKGGKTREKQRMKVAKTHEKPQNQRNDYLHKLSIKISKAYSSVIVEDIDMKEISAHLHLGKATMDNGFGILRRLLDYKLLDQDKLLIKVNKWFPSSKLCSHCHNIYSNLKLDVRTCVDLQII